MYTCHKIEISALYERSLNNLPRGSLMLELCISSVRISGHKDAGLTSDKQNR